MYFKLHTDFFKHQLVSHLYFNNKKSATKHFPQPYLFYIKPQIFLKCPLNNLTSFSSRRNLYFLLKTFYMHKQSTGGVLKNGFLIYFAKFTVKHLSQSLFFNNIAGRRPVNFIQKETPIQVFYCEFCKNFNKTFFKRTPPLAASLHPTSYSASIFKV